VRSWVDDYSPDDDGEVEIDFGPMMEDPRGRQDPFMQMRQGGPDPLMQMLAGAAAAGQGGASPRGFAGPAGGIGSSSGQAMMMPMRGGPAKGGREAELDNMLANVLGDMMQGGPIAGPMGSGSRSGQPRGGGPPGVTEEVVIEGPSGTEVMTVGGPGIGSVVPEGQTGKSGRLSGGLVRDLFPGAVAPPGGMESRAGSPFRADPMMVDIMGDLDRSFTEEMLPAIQKAAQSASPQDPSACQEDIRKNCAGAKSHLHCLGVNHDTISEPCRKQVGQSVPFRCNKDIDRFCDLLQKGILACLYDRMQDLESQCRDAVLATKHVIGKARLWLRGPLPQRIRVSSEHAKLG